MARILERTDLAALGHGIELLGSGGGGSGWMLQLGLAYADVWPLTVHDVADVDPSTPCMAVAFAGSTMLISERLPDQAPFAPAIAAIERWLGYPVPVVCSLEIGGMNGLAALPLAHERTVVDADLMGRALPDFDQLSIMVDALPHLVVATPTGGGGVSLVENARPDAVESIVRTSLLCNGGWSSVVVGGFTVGDLVEHGIVGSQARARRLGEQYLAALTETADSTHAALPTEAVRAATPNPSAHSVTVSPGIRMVATRIGATLLAAGRVSALQTDPDDLRLTGIEVRSYDADVVRLIARSELLACMRNGRVEAASPTIIVAIDEVSLAILQVHELTVGRHIAVLSLPAPEWWTSTPERRAHVSPTRYGLPTLEPTE